MDDLTSAATLDVSNLDATPIQRMPAIMNLDFLPDMGRMNGKLPWGERHGFFRTP
ncbi:hypothetical protein AWB78_08602 [Caballeronia calidae]|uniref:Uncharacterized protein n=1 Tax=Caballeronia calidae TaxID=1777139 RepID=A0A158EKW2_9BURK|nr:hypothetical protein AWB78_08602 [Caballeronia calidae]